MNIYEFTFGGKALGGTAIVAANTLSGATRTAKNKVASKGLDASTVVLLSVSDGCYGVIYFDDGDY